VVFGLQAMLARNGRFECFCNTRSHWFQSCCRTSSDVLVINSQYLRGGVGMGEIDTPSPNHDACSRTFGPSNRQETSVWLVMHALGRRIAKRRESIAEHFVDKV